MKKLEVIFFFSIFPFLSCETNEKEILYKWINGNTRLERIQSNTINCFIENLYYETGELQNVTKYKDSIACGESVTYHKNGKIFSKINYLNGKINGDVIEFFSTGKIMFKGNQVEGSLVGTASHYYENGKPESELYYKDNKAFLVNYWDSISVQKIKNGNGIKKFQDILNKDKNGKDTSINVLVVGIYKDSLHNGLWKYYNIIDNKLVLERTFKDDNLVSETWK
jgi:hypothetical protein